MQALYTLDLDGKNREQALTALNEHLPSWIETAMVMEDPFVIHVEIICGKGSQALCEEVERWIKREKNVSNAPKKK